MHAHNLRKHLVRAVAPPKFAAAVLVTLALLFAACSNSDPASRINAPPLLSSMEKGHPGGGSGPSLGAAADFVVLGGAGVTCTLSHVTGNVGSKLTVLNNAPVCTIAGNIHQGDAAAMLAFDNFVTAYNALTAMTCDVDLTSTPQLGGKTLASGVYCFSPDVTVLLNGQLTLTGSGPWVFQIGKDLVTGIGSVVIQGSGQPCNVFWQTGTAATIGAGSHFLGNILAGSAVTFTGEGSSLVGRALAKTAVTMTGTNVTLAGCGAGGGPGGGPHPSCTERGDRVTGGGWITGFDRKSKANFAVSGWFDSKKNAFQGHLEYDDKGVKGKSDDINVHGTGVTAFSVNGVTAHIKGTAKYNGETDYTYQVDVTDNGEPGRGKHGDGNDQFAITIWNASGAQVYSNSGTLGGGNIQLHKAHGRKCDNDLSKDWKIYNIDAATSKWDIDKAPAFAGGVAQFPFEQFVPPTSGSLPTSGSFAVYLLNKINFDITGSTISANVAWDQGAYRTRGPASDGAFVRLEFQDVGNGDFVSNDYWWSSVSLDLNTVTSGTLTAALTDRTLWTNICGQSATDVVAHPTRPGGSCTGGTDPAVSPFDGFTNAMKNVKLVGFSFGRASRFASGVAVVGGPASFRLNSFTITP